MTPLLKLPLNLSLNPTSRPKCVLNCSPGMPSMAPTASRMAALIVRLTRLTIEERRQTASPPGAMRLTTSPSVRVCTRLCFRPHAAPDQFIGTSANCAEEEPNERRNEGGEFIITPC